MERDKPDFASDEQSYVHADPVMDAALNWFFTLQAAPQDDDLRARFEAWRSASSLHADCYAEVAGSWDIPEMDTVAGQVIAKTGYPERTTETVVVNMRRPPKRVSTWIMSAAASVLLAIGVWQYPGLRLQWASDYMTVAGGRDDVTLPDGSRMVMNTDTAVAVNFEGAHRSIKLLKGEAYFDVVPDASRPFHVIGGFSDVVVKGTAFSVRTDDELDTIHLEHGHVDVSRLSDPEDTASLERGEKITARAGVLSAVEKNDGSNDFAWLQGQLIFEDQPFSKVLSEIRRYYGHSIIVANGEIGAVRVNGRYRLDNPERAIRSLATAVGASVTRVPGGILILR